MVEGDVEKARQENQADVVLDSRREGGLNLKANCNGRGEVKIENEIGIPR